jgi:phosphoglucomutase
LSQLDELTKVDLIFKKLHFLGIHFDPFQEVTVPEVQQIIEQMNLEIHLSNPYQATNILLQLLDDTEERLKQLKH